MHVQVKNELPSSPLDIHHEAVAGLINTGFPGSIPCPEGHDLYERTVFFRQIINTPDMPRRNDKQMNRGMGLDILENDNIFIAVNEISVSFSGYNLAKDAFLFHRQHLPRQNKSES
jgi:hypothetical protein